MTLLFKNNAASLLASTCSLVATSLTVTAGQGSRFPSPSAGQSFLVTIQSGSAVEVVECTARSGDVLTIARAKEGTSAQTWSAGSSVTLRITETALNGFLQGADAPALYAPLNGPITLTADPADGTKATRRSWVESQIAAAVTSTAVRPLARYVGEVIEHCGFDLPAQCVWAAGQAISRTTYAALFAAQSKTTTGNVVSGNATINTVADTSFAAAGMYIEGTGIAAGTTIVSFTVNTIVLSVAPSLSNNGVTLRVSPYPLGNGTTTFNVIDKRGRVGVGRDNMNGTAASRVTTAVSGLDGLRLGAVGGDQRMQQHLHSINDPGHVHVTDNQGLHEHNLEYATADIMPSGTGSPNWPYFMLQGTGSLTVKGSQGAGIHAHSVLINGTGVTINNSGSGATQNVQPSVVVNHVVYVGV